ncbi:hypothetical protein SAMN04488523_10813 [Sulfitobacter brevis]|uniref:Pentapeptide MXKDX repeat protein n=1 Tax=Sulfitobacter brevis TaxID=74348 RepID=A0A1I2B771_9RHOB|nr:hypothetical protein [Sulfitobacter brevis]SFE52005.1 hypothetical protein SAMN04488523_10813 [Sulfitobacter brevis]
MTYKTNLLAAALTAALLTTSAQAQDATSQADDMPMSKEHSMREGGMASMDGMMPMLRMMAQMGPMMEACTEMMASMNEDMKTAEPEVDKG